MLGGTGRHLPSPSLLLRPLQTREAVRSSSLEGTFTEPRQQALFELDPKYPESQEDPLNARREVFNYAAALRLGEDRRKKLPVSLRLIRELHEVLLEGVRGSDRNPGHFRRTQNQVGRPPRFVPPPPQLLPELLDQFEKYLHAEHRLDPLVEAFIVHYQFEAIHPFMDGNGRVGRLLLAILIEEWCSLSDQWLYMSSYFERNKDAYIDHLFKVSTEGAWEAWIEFCLEGVANQARDSQQRCEKLLGLHRDFHARLVKVRGSVRLAAIVDDLFRNPVAQVPTTAARHGVTYPTARADLSRLEAAGILKPFTNMPLITYYCEPIMKIIYSD